VFIGGVLRRFAADRDDLFARWAGRLGFEAALSRDYPVMFGTLFLFGLIGLVVNIISDLCYVLVDPRIDFETREG